MTEPAFTYNMRVEIEKVSKVFITQVEVSNYGRVKRTVLRTETFAEAVAQITAFRERTFAEIEAFLTPPAQPDTTVQEDQRADETGAQTAASPEAPRLAVAPAEPEKTPEEIAAQNDAAVAAVEAVKAAKDGAKPAKPKVVKPKKEERQFAAS